MSEVLTLNDLAGVRVEPDLYLVVLARRVTKGASDENVVDELVSQALAAPESGRDSWLLYVAASNAPEFLPVLKSWFENGSEDERVRLINTSGWNRSEDTNAFLLDVLEHETAVRVRRRALWFLVHRASRGMWAPVDLFELAEAEDWRPVTRREWMRVWNRG